jgi:hypothetical protein
VFVNKALTPTPKKNKGTPEQKKALDKAGAGVIE